MFNNNGESLAIAGGCEGIRQFRGPSTLAVRSSAALFFVHLPPHFFVHLPPVHLPPPFFLKLYLGIKGQKIKLVVVMHVVVAEVVDKKVNKVVEEDNKELVMDVVVEGVVDKEVTKVVEEVNKKLVKEVNDGLVLV